MNVGELKVGDLVRLTNGDIVEIKTIEHDIKNIAFPYIITHDKSVGAARYSRYGIKQGGDFRQGLMHTVDDKTEPAKEVEMKKNEFLKALSETPPKEVKKEEIKEVPKEQPYQKVLKDLGEVTEVTHDVIRKMPFSKSAGKPRFSTLDPKFIADLMSHMTKSKEKYPDIDGKPNYYRTPTNPKEDLLDPLMRHLLDVYEGKLIDEESGVPNLICCAARVMIAYHHQELLKGK